MARHPHPLLSDNPVMLRLPPAQLRRADALVRRVAKDPAVTVVGRVSRSLVLRLALQEGLATLEQRYGAGRSE